MLEATLQIYVACIIWDNIHEYYLPVTCSLVPLRRLLLHLAVGSSLEGHPPVYERWHPPFQILSCSITPDPSKLWIHISSLEELNHGLCTIWWRSIKIITRNESEFLIISLFSLENNFPTWWLIVIVESLLNAVAITLHGDSKEDWRFYQKGKLW